MSKILRTALLSILLVTVTFSGCGVIQQISEMPDLAPPCPHLFASITVNDAAVCVMRDYYTVDGVRTPLTVNQARAVAAENGWSLPTRELVDAIWAAADCRLEPITMPPTAAMTTPDYALRHHSLIEEQLFHSEYQSCNIIAGHKKDVLADGSIYGWHTIMGNPIQPVSWIHGDNYADYSHGIRFIINE